MDQAQKPPGVQESKRLMLERIALVPGEAVLDVGCGPGTDVSDMEEQWLESVSIDAVQVFPHSALVELFLGSHLVELQTNGTLAAGRAREWWEYLQRADEHGTLLLSFTAFNVVGSKR